MTRADINALLIPISLHQLHQFRAVSIKQRELRSITLEPFCCLKHFEQGRFMVHDGIWASHARGPQRTNFKRVAGDLVRTKKSIAATVAGNAPFGLEPNKDFCA